MRKLFVFMALAVLCLTAIGVAGEKTALGVAIRTLTNPYQDNYRVGGELFAKVSGQELVVLTCEGSSEKQVNDIKSLVARTKGDVVFMIDPNEATDVLPIAIALEEAGVYYATWWNKPEDINAWDYPHWVTHMSFDGISAGIFTATELFKTFPTPNKGKFIAIQGMLSNSIAQDRFNGVQQALAKFPDVQMVATESADWDRTKAYDKVKSMLVANPDIDGVWCANDNMGLGALEALRERGLAGKVKVTGTDGTDELIDAIVKGEAAATVYNDSKFQAGISLAQTLAAKNGKLVVADIPKEKRQFFCSAVNVSQANVQDIITNYIKGSTVYDYEDLFGSFVRTME
ncbi:MAG: sugar ABC transporter substrate-binding protein [Planctomycetota bacterium]|nr:sugar ABC transporter substrate-binding protein [Planctomycetota bacterium]